MMRLEPDRTPADPTTALTEARAEVDRLTTGLCSLILHDGERFGRVAVPNIVRLLLGEPMPWAVKR